MTDLDRMTDDTFQSNTGMHKSLFVKFFDVTRHRSHVDTPEKLYDLMFYMKTYPRHRALTTCLTRVGNSSRTIQRHLNEWRHSLFQALPNSEEISQCGMMRGSWLNRELNPKLPEKFRPYLPVDEIVGVVDTSPFVVRQPSASASSRQLYSGKEKACCIKAQAICDLAGRVIWWSGPYAGTGADLKIFMGDVPQWIHVSDKIMGDLAYWAPQQKAVNRVLVAPFKRNEGVPLLPIEQHFNNVFGHYRVKIEHIFGDIKNFDIFQNTLRQHKIIHNFTAWREYMHIAMYHTYLTQLLNPPDIQIWQ